MNKNQYQRALGSVDKTAQALSRLSDCVTALRLDTYGDFRMLRDSKIDFDDDELDRLIYTYGKLRAEADTTVDAITSILEANQLND